MRIKTGKPTSLLVHIGDASNYLCIGLLNGLLTIDIKIGRGKMIEGTAVLGISLNINGVKGDFRKFLSF